MELLPKELCTLVVKFEQLDGQQGYATEAGMRHTARGIRLPPLRMSPLRFARRSIQQRRYGCHRNNRPQELSERLGCTFRFCSDTRRLSRAGTQFRRTRQSHKIDKGVCLRHRIPIRPPHRSGPRSTSAWSPRCRSLPCIRLAVVVAATTTEAVEVIVLVAVVKRSSAAAAARPSPRSRLWVQSQAATAAAAVTVSTEMRRMGCSPHQ